jgi:uncharacterized protein (TIGR02453 family)
MPAPQEKKPAARGAPATKAPAKKALSKKAPITEPPPFAGFPKQGVSFFQGLAVSQSRDWFQAHKADYESLWRVPMLSLLTGLRGPAEKIYGRKVAPPKIFRINRDVRFSKDKSPYKLHCGGLLGFGEVSSPEGVAGLYVQLGLEEDFVATGFYQLEPDRLALLRKRILDEKSGSKLAKLVAAIEAKGQSVLSGEALKRAPSGVDPDHPRIELLRQKGLAVSFPAIPKAVRHTAGLEKWLLEQLKTAAPVVQWGFDNGLG